MYTGATLPYLYFYENQNSQKNHKSDIGKQMKKSILIISLLYINVTSAQFEINFESLMDQNVVSNTDKLISYRDSNPKVKGINTSENVVKVIELPGAEYWSSTIVDKFQRKLNFKNGRYFSVDFLSPKSKGMITLKFGKDIEKDFIYSGKANTWRRAVFNFSDISKSTTSLKIEIFFDLKDYSDPSTFTDKNMSEEVFWFDNIRQSKRRIRKKR